MRVHGESEILATLPPGWAKEDPLRAGLGWPGPWRPVKRGRGTRLAFDRSMPGAPRWELAGGGGGAGGEEGWGDDAKGEGGEGGLAGEGTGPDAVREAILRWARDTAGGGVPPAWRAPDRATVEELVPPRSLAVARGAQACAGEVVVEERRLALACPVVAAVEPPSAVLSRERRECLREMLFEAHDRWRLVRWGILVAAGESGGDAPAPRRVTGVRAEVDLTGVPAFLLVPLLRRARDTLRFVVGLHLEAIAVLLETRATLRSLRWLDGNASSRSCVRRGSSPRVASDPQTTLNCAAGSSSPAGEPKEARP